MGRADSPVNFQMVVVANTGQEALAGRDAAAGQAGSDATLAPSAAALAVSHAALAAIAVAQDDTAVVESAADLAGSAADLAGSAAALAAATIAPVAVNPLQITTVAARQRCQHTLSPLLLLIVRLACPILAPSSTLGPSPFPLDLHLAMGPNI